jgi:hypothetical protein
LNHFHDFVNHFVAKLILPDTFQRPVIHNYETCRSFFLAKYFSFLFFSCLHVQTADDDDFVRLFPSLFIPVTRSIQNEKWQKMKEWGTPHNPKFAYPEIKFTLLMASFFYSPKIILVQYVPLNGITDNGINRLMG